MDAAQRLAAMNFPGLAVLPAPDSSISADDRLHLLGCYALGEIVSPENVVGRFKASKLSNYVKAAPMTNYIKATSLTNVSSAEES